ncbi:hypothetical protein V8G54_033197 [Vigna mungo]|uniref:Uncharacterized protein n=1 Tax=Vigna mungo TaxID=3915 RepID=A0AAQ3MPD7_VIGMU
MACESPFLRFNLLENSQKLLSSLAVEFEIPSPPASITSARYNLIVCPSASELGKDFLFNPVPIFLTNLCILAPNMWLCSSITSSTRHLCDSTNLILIIAGQPVLVSFLR